MPSVEESDIEALWQNCLQTKPANVINGLLHRIVESQEQVATNRLTDGLDEQFLLEQMLESVKPEMPKDSDDLHYLLSTPFRYPPLPWGSRFGRRFEPSLFYGSRSIKTTLAETAFYRFIFWHGMTTPPPSKKLITQHTVFSARYYTSQGMRLQEEPFKQHRDILQHPSDYQACQLLGSMMRKNGIKGFEYYSARCRDDGTNVALFKPSALISREPFDQQAWLCETRADTVLFSGSGRVEHFDIEHYYVDGKLPAPA